MSETDEELRARLRANMPGPGPMQVYERAVVFVLGAPGAGKTTLVRMMLGEICGLLPAADEGGPKLTVGLDAIAAGHYTGQPFDGADTVPYNGARAWLEFWRDRVLPSLSGECLTILDGDRFSNASTLEFLRSVPGIRIAGVFLDVSDDKLAERRARRGSNQNATWLKGRLTKARRFAQEIGAYNVDANTCDAIAIWDEVSQWLDYHLFGIV